MITGTDLKNAMISGANNIVKHKASVDELNIFPVPDGDTGTNMSMTMNSAADALKQSTGTAAEVAKTAAAALLRGARGNSGVILSLLFRGFAKGVEGLEVLNGLDLVSALGIGVEAAYKAVMKPTEGTILTVSRVACERGQAAAQAEEDAAAVWEAVCQGAQEALAQTPELLPVLKRAGVVDAGGKGLCYIFEGMRSVFSEDQMIDSEEESAGGTEEADPFRSAAARFDTVINYTYCTEFIVGRDPECQKDPQDLRAFLETIGDCVLVVDDEEIVKVHVHTESPGNALEAGLAYGQLLTVKIENMKEQHRKAAEEEKAKEADILEPAEPAGEVGFVAVAAGEGLKTLFTDLGCSQVVSGGQSMNPSTEQLVEAILATPAKTVLVLPNNKNIILAAEQTIPLVKDRKVIVLPTRTIPQGLSAMLAYNPDSATEVNTITMMEAASTVDTGTVTYAARDSEFGGKKIRQGDVLGLVNGKLELVEKDRNIVHSCIRLVRSMVGRGTSFVTLIYGGDITEEMANETSNRIKAKLSSDIEVTVVDGGQPVYYFIVSVE